MYIEIEIRDDLDQMESRRPPKPLERSTSHHRRHSMS